MLDDARLFHVNLNVSRLAPAESFWCDGLGFALGVRTAPEVAQDGAAFGLDRAQWDAAILTGRAGFEGGVLDVLEWLTPPPTGAAPATYFTTGFQRLGIGVADLDTAIASLRTAGGHTWSEPLIRSSDAASHIRLVHASEPDDIGVELFEILELSEVREVSEPGGRGPQLAFVSVVCADLERSLTWYEAMGFRAVGRFESAGDDGTALRIDGPYAFSEVLLRPPGGGDASVMLVGFATPRPFRAAARPANSLGIWRCAFTVGDLDRCVAELRGRDVALLSDPAAMAMGPGLPELRFVCLRGPDQEVLELIESPS